MSPDGLSSPATAALPAPVDAPGGRPADGPLSGAEGRPGVLEAIAPMSAAHVHRYRMHRAWRFAPHRHEDHELLWASHGTLTVETGPTCWMVPANLGLWLPAGVVHAVEVSERARFYCTYFAVDGCPVAWPEPAPVAMGPLLQQLLAHLVDGELTPRARRHAEAVVFDLLVPADLVNMRLPMPTDERARAVADALLAHPADSRPLEGWGRHVGASRRTLARLFVDQTGLSFARWRREARLRRALVELAAGAPVGLVAHQVGFRSPSAFVEAFRRHTGRTPGAYFAPSG